MLCERYGKPAKTQTQAGVQRAWVARQLRKSPPRAQDSPAGLQGQAQGEGGGGGCAVLGLPGSHGPIRKLRAESFGMQGYFNIKMVVPAPWNPASLESGQGKHLSQPRKHSTGPGRTFQPPWNRSSSKTGSRSGGGHQAGGRRSGGGGPNAPAPAPPATGLPGAETAPGQPTALTQPPRLPPPPMPGFLFRPEENTPAAAQPPI